MATDEGRLYLAGVKGLYSGELVGYAMHGSMAEALVMQALFRAVATREQARQEISEYIEIFYNRMRKQARLGHLSPAAFTQKYYADWLAP